MLFLFLKQILLLCLCKRNTIVAVILEKSFAELILFSDASCIFSYFRKARRNLRNAFI